MRIERISGAILILLSGVLLLMAAYPGWNRNDIRRRAPDSEHRCRLNNRERKR